MKFIVLVVAACCGLSAALPAVDVVGNSIQSAGDLTTSGVNLGFNGASMGISGGDWAVSKGLGLVNSTAQGGMDIALDTIIGGIELANNTIQSSVNLASNAIKSVGNNMKGLPGFGGIIQAGTNMTASILDRTGSVIGSGMSKLNSFERKKIGYMKKGMSYATGKAANLTSFSFNFAKNGIASASSAVSGGINSATNKTASTFSSMFSWLG